MTVADLKQLKEHSYLTFDELSSLSGIPAQVIEDIFSGVNPNPKYATLLALEQVLVKQEKIPFRYDERIQEPVLIREESVAYQYSSREYDSNDIDLLSEQPQAELINGKIYMSPAPGRMHQFIITELLFCIKSYIKNKKGTCQVYTSPFDVRLFGDDKTIVQPDLLIICKKEILTEKGCTGAPDWVIEIVSESNASHDYITKNLQYQKAGVREYWIIDPFQKMVTAFNFASPQASDQYRFDESVSSLVIDGLCIIMEELLKEY